MPFGAFFPTWEGACRALPAQVLLVGALAGALVVYARQRHSPTHVAIFMATGFLAGLAVGLGLACWPHLVTSLALAMPAPGLWVEEVIAFFELGLSAVAASLGLVAGWISLECLGRFFWRPLPDWKALSVVNWPEENADLRRAERTSEESHIQLPPTERGVENRP